MEARGAPQRLTIDLDATLIGSALREGGRGRTFKGGFGFHPMLAYADQTGEALAGELRPGNAGANTAVDQIAVAEQALAQIPAEHIESIELLLRADSAGASHELLDWCREARIRFSVGYDLTETVRGAILEIPAGAWVAAQDQDGGERPNGQVCEITSQLDLSTWPAGSRVLVRRERAHPGAQLTFTDHDGHRFQAILTDQPDSDIAAIERDHRGRARVEDHIRNDKDTGLRNLPFSDFEHNRVWLELVALAHDLICWTQRLLLSGELAKASPSACATACCTSPPASPCTPAPPSCAYKRPGPGPASSPPPSRASKRSPRPADRRPPAPPTTSHRLGPRAPAQPAPKRPPDVPALPRDRHRRPTRPPPRTFTPRRHRNPADRRLVTRLVNDPG